MTKRRPGLSPRYARLALLTTVLAGCFVQDTVGQYDPNAPEPIPRLKGTLFLGGGGELPGEVYQRFVEMAGGESARLVVLSAGTADGPAAEQLGRYTDASAITTLSQARGQLANFAESIGRASGVWIDGENGNQFAQVFGGTEVETALRELIARRGVIGANGDISKAMTAVRLVGGIPEANMGTGLDLVPGSVIDVGFEELERKMRFVDVMNAYPSLVGLGIEEGTVMIVHQRFIDVLGSGSVFSYIAPSEDRPMRMEQINGEVSPRSQRRSAERQAEMEKIIAEWRASQQPAEGQRGRRGRGQRGRGRGERPWQPRRLADLIAMSRTAQARTLPEFPAEEPPEPRLENGTLIIVGGGGSPPGLTERFIELAGGPDHAYLVYVPCSEAEEITDEPGIVDSWRRAGVRSVTWIHTKDRNKANTDEWILDKLRRATGIWFGGGRQWNLVDSYQHTTAHKLMHQVLERGGVIGGSSAGASIQGSYMARGNPVGNVDPMADGYETGLGFITGMAIDQHFTQRGRLPDMTALVNRYPQLLGVGLDEASSIIVQGSVAEVFTREGRNVHFYDRKIPVEEDKPDYIELVHGQLFDLVERKVLTPEVDVTAEATAEAAGEAVEGVAGEQNPFVGTWDVTAYTEGGENTSTLQINPDLTLSFETAQFEVEATNLTIEGNQISFEISGPNFPQAALFQGQLDEGVLTGSISFGGETFADLEGRKRVVETAPAPAVAEVSGAAAFIGKWEITSSSDFGETTNILRIEPDLSATYESGEFPAEISNLKIDGNQLSYELQFGNFAASATFQGVLEEGVLTGTISFQGQVFADVRGRKLDSEGPAVAAEAEPAEAEPAEAELPENAAAAAFIGRWEITSTSDFGENTNIMRIEPDLSIVYENSQFDVEVSNLKIDGNQLSYELRFGNFEGSGLFQGVLEEGVLTGTISFQGQVFADITGRKLDGESPENAPAAAVAEEAEPANAFIGRWELTALTDFGENTSIMRIGPDLSIVYEDSQFDVEVFNLNIDGKQISYELGFGNFEGSAVFQGVVEEGVLTGTISFQGQVFADITGRKLDGENAENAPAAAAGAMP